MSFIKSINNAFVKCFDFKTRATRSEFWYFYLFTTVIGFIGLQFDQLFELQILGIDLNNSPGTIMFPIYATKCLFIYSKASRHQSIRLVVVNCCCSLYWNNYINFLSLS